MRRIDDDALRQYQRHPLNVARTVSCRVTAALLRQAASLPRSCCVTLKGKMLLQLRKAKTKPGIMFYGVLGIGFSWLRKGVVTKYREQVKVGEEERPRIVKKPMKLKKVV